MMILDYDTSLVIEVTAGEVNSPPDIAGLEDRLRFERSGSPFQQSSGE